MPNDSIAFVLAVTRQGPMWLNQFDCEPGRPDIGVSAELSRDGERFKGIGVLVCALAEHRRKIYGDGVVVIDGGANIGTFTVPWAQFMRPHGAKEWGRVIAFEPQKWPFMQLCANVVTNNCYNADPRRLVLGASCGSERVPAIHPLIVHNSGGVHVGDESMGESEAVAAITIDSLELTRLDVLKLDVESMEPQALAGARDTIARCKPLIIAEAALCGAEKIAAALPDYAIIGAVDAICIPALPENQQLIGAMAKLAEHLK